MANVGGEARVGGVAGALRHPLTLILLLALALRLPFAFIPGYAHPDELYQHIEQAHRLATGYGVVPWEYRQGIRSWLLPVLLAPFVAVHDTLGLEGSGYITAIRAFFVLLSLAVVASFYAIGRHFSATHALIAGFVGAVWFELVYFSSHTLGESASLATFMPAAWLLLDARQARPAKLAAAGFLLGLTVLFRFQLLPAVGVLALFTCWLRFKQAWLPLAIGGALAMLLGTAVDLSQGVVPFSWLFKNFAANIVEGRAASFGVQGPHFYIGAMLVHWTATAVLLVPLALIGARRYPALFLALVAHLVLHTLVEHKEYRFVLLPVAGVVLFAALGFADALQWVIARLPDRRTAVLATALVFWLLTSLFLAFGERYRYRWFSHYPALTMTAEAGRTPGLCGVAFNMHSLSGGGYSYLHRPVPIYEFQPWQSSMIGRSQAAFNAIVTSPSGAKDVPASYRRVRCIEPPLPDPDNWQPDAGAACLFVRPGACSAVPGLPTVNQALRARNE